MLNRRDRLNSRVLYLTHVTANLVSGSGETLLAAISGVNPIVVGIELTSNAGSTICELHDGTDTIASRSLGIGAAWVLSDKTGLYEFGAGKPIEIRNPSASASVFRVNLWYVLE